MRSNFIKFSLLICVSSSLNAEEKTRKQIDDEFVKIALKLGDEYKIKLQEYLKKETTEIVVYSIDEPNQCESCKADKTDLLFDPNALFKLDKKKVRWCPSLLHYATIYRSTSFKIEKDKDVLDEFFSSFTKISNKAHDKTSIIYIVDFLRDKEILDGDDITEEQEILYSTTISYNSSTMEFILPTGFSYGGSFDINLKLEKLIKQRLPLNRQQKSRIGVKMDK